MIETVKTIKMIREYSKNKNAPISFLCNDYELYYAKYIQETNEFDCLIYELFCNKLAKQIGLTIPEVKFIEISPNSLATDKILNNGNKIFFHPGIVAFGVKDIGGCDMVTNLPLVVSRKDYNQLSNPNELILLSLFDMHVGHRDRYPGNFNLLLTKGYSKTFYAIDHYDTFGALMYLGKINPNLYFSVDSTILRSDLVQQFILRYYDVSEIIELIDKYSYICNPQVINTVLDEVFNHVPDSWKLSTGLKEKMRALLNNEARIKNIQEQTLNYIQLIRKSQ
jgi:hypothetical protein